MDVHALLRMHDGLITRQQVLAAGLSPRLLRDGGRLLRVRHGVYTDAAAFRSLPAPARAALEVAAARRVSDVDLVAAGATACLVHGLPLLGPRPSSPVLVERKQDRPRHHGTSTTLLPHEVVHVSGVPVTSLARTAADVARARGVAAGVVTADAVLRAGVPRAELDGALRDRQTWPGAEAARRATDFADPRSESALESLGRVRFTEEGLPPPDLQVLCADEDGPFARVDHCWEEHRTIAEADGALKYSTPADVFAEKRREDRLRELGFEVVRYTWDDALHRPGLLAVRLQRAFARAARRSAA